MNKKELESREIELEQNLATPEVFQNPEKMKNLGIELARVRKRLALISELEETERELGENKEILSGSDEDLKAIAAGETEALGRKKLELEKKLSEEEEDLPENLIMEIRAGAGGDEAGLFAAELIQMYSSYARHRGWEVILLDEAKNDVGGCKEAVLEIDGDGAYRALRWESGVHRVQRIPETEKTGRIHTSTATVAVLPQAREVDIEVRPQDIKIEFFRSSGPGGQNVNKVETAVRIYHLPTGVVVTCQESRSQQKNREKAMTVLRSKLLDTKMQEEAKKMAAQRRQQIGTGDRSEKIRTYNFPQDRVTDHRIKESWHNLPSVMEGNIAPIIEALQNTSKEGGQ